MLRRSASVVIPLAPVTTSDTPVGVVQPAVIPNVPEFSQPVFDVALAIVGEATLVLTTSASVVAFGLSQPNSFLQRKVNVVVFTDDVEIMKVAYVIDVEPGVVLTIATTLPEPAVAPVAALAEPEIGSALATQDVTTVNDWF